MKLMKALGTDPKKIRQEGEKYFCNKCSKPCLIINGGKTLESGAAFILKSSKEMSGFGIWICWKPK